MAGSYNPETNAINLPCGDTANITVEIPEGTYDTVLFTIYNHKKKKDLLVIPVPFTAGIAVIRLANRHTRDLTPGSFKWNLRFVSDPEYDDNGNIILEDDSDNVMTLFGSDDNPLPDFMLRKDGAHV